MHFSTEESKQNAIKKKERKHFCFKVQFPSRVVYAYAFI